MPTATIEAPATIRTRCLRCATPIEIRPGDTQFCDSMECLWPHFKAGELPTETEARYRNTREFLEMPETEWLHLDPKDSSVTREGSPRTWRPTNG